MGNEHLAQNLKWIIDHILTIHVYCIRRSTWFKYCPNDIDYNASPFTLGWGHQYKQCQTDFWGPMKFLPCADEWKFNGKTYQQHCETSVDPPMHPVCKEFYQTVQGSKVKPMGPVVIQAEEVGFES